MTVRVRFAPSPTGNLHIGGARTALYNYIFAKAQGGKFILRIEDTDLERSTKEYEAAQIADIKWLGLEYDEGPDCPGEYGPYRQSERMDIYQKYAHDLVDKGLAFYDFCSEEELEKMKEEHLASGTAAYTGIWREAQHFAKAKERIAAGEKAPIRYLVNPTKAYSFHDSVRDEVNFPAGMVGDFVILRSSGMPTYNFCCVIDDALMKITHVIRGEDHVNNTLRQIMIYEAIGVTPPKFTHASLLIGEDRQKLSKRHGATSVTQYREESYLPEALSNYLCLLGWSHPEEKDIFTIQDLQKVFDLNRFSKSHAVYDIEKLKWINGQHIKHMDDAVLLEKLRPQINASHVFHKQTPEWQLKCVALFKEKITLLNDFEKQVDEYIFNEKIDLTDELKEILSWETTPTIATYLKSELSSISETYIEEETLDKWMAHCKTDLGVKGKPLFMGLRGILTGHGHGPDLKVLVPLTPVAILKKRLEA